MAPKVILAIHARERFILSPSHSASDDAAPPMRSKGNHFGALRKGSDDAQFLCSMVAVSRQSSCGARASLGAIDNRSPCGSVSVRASATVPCAFWTTIGAFSRTKGVRKGRNPVSESADAKAGARGGCTFGASRLHGLVR